jgi:hypothetical protein
MESALKALSEFLKSGSAGMALAVACTVFLILYLVVGILDPLVLAAGSLLALGLSFWWLQSFLPRRRIKNAASRARKASEERNKNRSRFGGF